jgi:hypothetical protein
MPIGFFDKYFNDEDDDKMTLLSNQSNQPTKTETPVIEQEPVEVLKPKKKVEENDTDMRARILQAAQQYMVVL